MYVYLKYGGAVDNSNGQKKKKKKEHPSSNVTRSLGWRRNPGRPSGEQMSEERLGRGAEGERWRREMGERRMEMGRRRRGMRYVL